MAKGRLISTNFWMDGKVEDDFTPEDKYGYLWCLTNPHTNLCGCYEVSIKQIAHEMGYNTDTVERLLKRLDGSHNVIRYSAATKELLVLNWYRYNWNTSEKLDKPLLAEIRTVKCDRFREYLADRYNERWGNWSQSVGSEHYVGYTWDEAVTVGGADIYWYDDGGGTQVPSKLRMQYLDANGAWQDVNITTPFESSIAKNKYNRVEFDRITTTRLRLYVTVRSGAAANGIYRFKVYSSVDVASLNEVFLATKPGVMPTLPSNVTAVTSDGALISVPVTWETLTADMIATDGEVKLRGVNNSTGKMTTCTIYVRSDMDKATITSVEPVEVTTTQGVVPTLPKTVKVGYNNGAFDNQTVKVTWPAITAAELANVGDVNREGEVEGTATKAMLTIHVLKGPAAAEGRAPQGP